MRRFLCASNSAIVTALSLTLVVACFTELDNLRCERDSDCFEHEGEWCRDGTCVLSQGSDSDAGDSDTNSQAPVQVTGTVLGTDQEALDGAYVCAADRLQGRTRIGTSGQFSIEVDGPPPVDILASHSQYRNEIQPAEEMVVSIDFQLSHCDDVDCSDQPQPCP